MKDITRLPPEYIAFQELVICGNRFINGTVPIEVETTPVLLIGQGEPPLVWISVPGKQRLKPFALVVNNQSRESKISVFWKTNSTVIFFKSSITMLYVTKESDEKAIVPTLDLRPIGLSIFGNEDSLTVANTVLENNTFKNIRAMIRIGGE